MEEEGRNGERERGEGTDHGQTLVIYHILKVVESDNKKWLSGNNAKFGATTLQKKTKPQTIAERGAPRLYDLAVQVEE